MVRTVIFDEDYKPKEVKEDFSFHCSHFYWTHMHSKENVLEILMKCLEKDKAFIDDIIEEQRPNIIRYDGVHVVVLSFPLVNAEILQITFIMARKKIITITNSDNKIINDIIDNLLRKGQKITGITKIFSMIIDAVTEKSIKELEVIEEDIENKEVSIFEQRDDRKLLSYTNKIKQDLSFVSKLLRGDLEVMRDIVNGKVPVLNLHYVGEHIEDRLLYLHDYTELIKESINNVNNIYMTMLSHKLNQHIYALTIIGALMIIPTIISGFFGMNVELPIVEFWEIAGLTALLSLGTYFILRLLF